MKTNALLVAIAALVVGGLIGYYAAGSSVYSGKATTKTANSISKNELDLRMSMRKLWEDHITWTRLYIISAATDSPDKDMTAARLLRNQEDLGNAIKPYYGNQAGDQLTKLLKDHILQAAALVDAAKKGDDNALNKANTDWYNNANQIADFLSRANPNLPNSTVRDMMKTHLDLTKQEAVDILNKNYAASITDYDRIHNEILMMSDALSDGVIKQFPDKFK